MTVVTGTVANTNVKAVSGRINGVIASCLIEYNILTQVVATVIMEWNIGTPVSGQIRQTSADRTDFAY